VPNLIRTGATVKCSYGTETSSFSATGTEVSAATPVGVVSDVTAANVPPFGLCTSLSNPQVAEATRAAQEMLTPQPCVPVLSNWSPGSVRVTIGTAAALNDAAQCTCSWRGVVTVTDAGQTSATAQ
jgi:Domain of unknown function (DUF4280)